MYAPKTTGYKRDAAEAEKVAKKIRARPDVKAWMDRARELFKDLPKGTRIYWQEDHMNLMALSQEGDTYETNSGGEETAAVVDSVIVPGSDCGAW